MACQSIPRDLLITIDLPAPSVRPKRDMFSRRQIQTALLLIGFVTPPIRGTSPDPPSDAFVERVNGLTPGELEKVPLIGTVLSERLIRARDRLCGFRFLEQITQIRGFGPERVQALKTSLAQSPDSSTSNNGDPGSSRFSDSSRSLGSFKRHSRPRLDINVATQEDLSRIPGIRRGLASQIVAERLRNGDFRHFHDLYVIPGITRRVLAHIQTRLCIDEL